MPANERSEGRARKGIRVATSGWRGARRPRREERAYPVYASDEQRRLPGCIASQNATLIPLRPVSPREGSGDSGVPSSERVGGSAGATPPEVSFDQ